MLRLDNNLLEELGLGSLPEEQKRQMLQHIYETLELRVGTHLANQMTDKQLEEFERFIDSGGDANQTQALQWLEANLPNYKQVVNDTFEALKAEVKQMAPQLLTAASQQPAPSNQPQAVVAQPPVTPQQPYIPPSPTSQPLQPPVSSPIVPPINPQPMPQPPVAPFQPAQPQAVAQPPVTPQQPYIPPTPQPMQASPFDQTLQQPQQPVVPQPWQPAHPTQQQMPAHQTTPIQSPPPQVPSFQAMPNDPMMQQPVTPQPWQPAHPAQQQDNYSQPEVPSQDENATNDYNAPASNPEPPKSDWQPSPTRYQPPQQ